jgi:hypothetical protein
MPTNRNRGTDGKTTGSVGFFNKEYALIQEDTNYIQFLQQRNALVAIRMHTAKKKRIMKKNNPALANNSL